MQVNSSTHNYITQRDSSKKANNNEYLHRAIKLNVPGKQNRLEFRDLESGKLVELNIHEEIQRNLKSKFSVEFKDNKTVKATGALEKYLQTMWSKYTNDTNTKDINNDGYLDENELLKSKRVSEIGYDNNHKVTLYSSKSKSHLEVYGNKAIEEIDKFLQGNGITDGKVSVDRDFNGFLNMDKNLDTNFQIKRVYLPYTFQKMKLTQIQY